MDIKRETSHIRGLAKTLVLLADEIDKTKLVTSENIELLKKIGGDILFKGVTIGYRE